MAAKEIYCACGCGLQLNEINVIKSLKEGDYYCC